MHALSGAARRVKRFGCRVRGGWVGGRAALLNALRLQLRTVAMASTPSHTSCALRHDVVPGTRQAGASSCGHARREPPHVTRSRRAVGGPQAQSLGQRERRGRAARRLLSCHRPADALALHRRAPHLSRAVHPRRKTTCGARLRAQSTVGEPNSAPCTVSGGPRAASHGAATPRASRGPAARAPGAARRR